MKLLTFKEVREILRIDSDTLRKIIKSGALPAMKAGVGANAPYRISETALKEYMRRETKKVSAS